MNAAAAAEGSTSKPERNSSYLLSTCLSNIICNGGQSTGKPRRNKQTGQIFTRLKITSGLPVSVGTGKPRRNVAATCAALISCCVALPLLVFMIVWFVIGNVRVLLLSIQYCTL